MLSTLGLAFDYNTIQQTPFSDTVAIKLPISKLQAQTISMLCRSCASIISCLTGVCERIWRKTPDGKRAKPYNL